MGFNLTNFDHINKFTLFDTLKLLREKYKLDLPNSMFILFEKVLNYGNNQKEINVYGQHSGSYRFKLTPKLHGEWRELENLYKYFCDPNTPGSWSDEYKFEDFEIYLLETYFFDKKEIFSFLNINDEDDSLDKNKENLTTEKLNINLLNLEQAITEKDIKISHDDLLKLLPQEYFNKSSQQEIKSLQAQLKKKDEEIAQLKLSLNNSSIKADTASNNKKNAFIKSLLPILYGEEVASNPRPHIYDPNSSEKGKDGSIQKSFELHGLDKYLPSGRTLNNWVKGIDLDTSK